MREAEPPPDWVTPDQMEWFVRNRMDSELSSAMARDNNEFRERLKHMPVAVRKRWNEKDG